MLSRFWGGLRVVLIVGRLPDPAEAYYRPAMPCCFSIIGYHIEADYQTYCR